jgi:SAM-dependent methyltransferase
MLSSSHLRTERSIRTMGVRFPGGKCGGGPHACHAMQRIIPVRLRGTVRELADVAFAGWRGYHRATKSSDEVVGDEHARGRWEYLNDIQEMSRYAVVAGYCRYGGTASSVLDLGCGFGVLRGWLDPLQGIEYVGVDLSDVAIERAAQAWTDDATTFVAMDVAKYVPDRKFDLIIFNEVLYYFGRPDEILERYGRFLEANGRFIISLWEARESSVAWRRSRSAVQVLDETETRHCSGVSWKIRFCRPRRRFGT